MTRAIILWGSCLHWQDPLLIFSSICAGHHEMTWILLDGFFTNFYGIKSFMQGHGHPSYKWLQDIPCALRTIFKNYHLHQGSSCHLTISIASSGLHDLCKVIRVFIKGSKTSWASPLSTKASGSSLGSSASSAGLLQELQQSGDIDAIKTMLASMTISSTVSDILNSTTTF